MLDRSRKQGDRVSSSLAITSPTPRQSAEPSTWFVPLAALATIAGLYAALIYSPADRVERDVMRLLYVHVPAAFSMHIAYGLCFMASVMYLWRRNERWDQVALVGAEVATMFCTVVLLTGPVWAKVSWGTWWVWDARLTSTLLLWLIFVGYLMLRSYGGQGGQLRGGVDGERVARHAAVLAIVGFADVPIVHYSARWFRTLHPQAKILAEGSPGQGLNMSMLGAFSVCMMASLLLFGALVTTRLRLERAQLRLDALEIAQARRRPPMTRPLPRDSAL